MKKLIMSSIVLASALFSSTSFADCDEWGSVDYVYSSTSTSAMAIVNGTACWVTGSNTPSAVAILATANANDKNGFVTSTGEAAIEMK